jgi:hypothetical protein
MAALTPRVIKCAFDAIAGEYVDCHDRNREFGAELYASDSLRAKRERAVANLAVFNAWAGSVAGPRA